MSCACKQSPLEKVEMRIRTSGWTRLAPSQLAVIDGFIHNKLGEYPTTMEQRIELYKRAKIS